MAMRILGIVAALIALYVASFLLFVAALPTRPDHALKADGIVALTGGDARLDAAVALLEGGVARRLLISGFNKASTKDELRHLSNGRRRFDCCADIGYAAEDTYGNAEEAAAWVTAHRYKSLILVTASYHMPRSLLELKRALPEVHIVEHPVVPDGFRQDDWWRWPGSGNLVVLEYNKYLAARVRHALADFVMGRAPAPVGH